MFGTRGSTHPTPSAVSGFSKTSIIQIVLRFKHTHRPGFWLGFIDFFTAGLFFLLYMPLGGLQDELKDKAIDMGLEGPYTSWWHMFGWNTFGLLLMGPAVATGRFFDTLNRIEQKYEEVS